MNLPPTQLRWLGRQDYVATWQAMRAFTHARCDTDADEIWVVEHPPVYTLGLNGRMEHLLDAGDIPVVRSDRGGQITYHGPGQVLFYTLLDLQRRQLGIRAVVSLLEQTVIRLLGQYGLAASARPEAPGVYLDAGKIASVGLKVSRGCCYHGLSLNNQLDLEPFSRIHPCGYVGQRMTQLAAHGVHVSAMELAFAFFHHFVQAWEQP